MSHPHKGRWSADEDRLLTGIAASGATANYAAIFLKRSETAVRIRAHILKVRFTGGPFKFQKHERGKFESDPSYAQWIRDEAASELARQIRLAKAEAATAPLYRGGWPV